MTKGYFDRNPKDRYKIIDSKTKKTVKFGRKLMIFRTFQAAQRFLNQYFTYGEFEIKDNYVGNWRSKKKW